MADKSNEILSLPDLLEPLDLDGKVVTADAIHTQTNPAQWIRDRGDHNVVMVKNNQKTLHLTLKALPWKSVPSTFWVDTGHGRRVRRTVKADEAPDWVDFLATAEVVQVRCTRTTKNHKSTGRNGKAKTTTVEVVYPILLPAHGRRPTRGHRRLVPKSLGNREPISLVQEGRLR